MLAKEYFFLASSSDSLVTVAFKIINQKSKLDHCYLFKIII